MKDELQSVVVLFAIIWMNGVHSPAERAVQCDPSIRLEIRAEKKTYYVGEVITLRATLFNQGDRPIEGSFLLALDYDCSVSYRRGGGEFIKYQPGWVAFHPFLLTAPSILPPRGIRTAKISLFYNTSIQQLVLSEPGQYQFKAYYGRVESNITRIKVVDPPEKDRAALAALRDSDLLRFVEGDISLYRITVEPLEPTAEKAEAFLKAYPQTIYAPLVERVLRYTLEEAVRVDQYQPGYLTPRLKAIKERLPEK
jgi:hypothetical protein